MAFGLRHLFTKNEFENFQNFKSIRFGVVEAVDRVANISDNEGQRERDRRFNADPFMIRARVLGANHDKNKTTDELPNCFPLMPKHINIPPKVGELVLLFFFSNDLSHSDRLYIGPLISSLENISKEEVEDATSSFSIGLKEPIGDLSKRTELEGVYPDNKDISLQGRNNTDIQFKDNEIRIRAGKFTSQKIGDTVRREYNQKNPAYFQIKYDVPLEKENNEGEQKKGSVANIVADKINILGVQTPIETSGSNSKTVRLTDSKTLIDDESLVAILERAEPLLFGNKTVKYLEKLEKLVLTHVHAGHGLPPVTLDNNATLNEVAQFDKSTLVSKNVRIN